MRRAVQQGATIPDRAGERNSRQTRGMCRAMWYCSTMATVKPASKKSSGFVLGRGRFAKISAVEGITKSAESRRMFEEFDRKGLTPEQRRKAIFEKYAKKA